jgi:ATP-dependent Clp protease adapter protein ClpS
MPITKSGIDDRIKKIEFPKYNIIIWNDNVSDFEMVVRLIQHVFNYSEMEAYGLTTQIHEENTCIVWSGSYEVGELKLEQSKTFIAEHKEYLSQLKITLEEVK